MRRGMGGGMMRGMQKMTPQVRFLFLKMVYFFLQKVPDLPVDPENEEFIIFVRSKNVRE